VGLDSVEVEVGASEVAEVAGVVEVVASEEVVAREGVAVPTACAASAGTPAEETAAGRSSARWSALSSVRHPRVGTQTRTRARRP
jgi:hypothetical protein